MDYKLSIRRYKPLKTTEIKTIKLEAEEGKMLTDGNTYGSIIYLASNRSVNEFYEITIAEYEKIMAEQEKEALENGFGT